MNRYLLHWISLFISIPFTVSTQPPLKVLVNLWILDRSNYCSDGLGPPSRPIQIFFRIQKSLIERRFLTLWPTSSQSLIKKNRHLLEFLNIMLLHRLFLIIHRPDIRILSILSLGEVFLFHSSASVIRGQERFASPQLASFTRL